MEREILKTDYQSLFSEDFYFGFRFWTIFSCSFKVLVDFLRGFSVSNMLLRPPRGTKPWTLSRVYYLGYVTISYGVISVILKLRDIILRLKAASDGFLSFPKNWSVLKFKIQLCTVCDVVAEKWLCILCHSTEVNLIWSCLVTQWNEQWNDEVLALFSGLFKSL